MKIPIQVDRNIGSVELAPILKGELDMAIEIKDLPTGDVIFDSPHGPNDLPCRVAFERKRISEVLGTIESGKFSGGQLKRLCKEFDFVYFILEGKYRRNPVTEQIELPRGRKGAYRAGAFEGQNIHWLRLDSFLNTLRLKTGTSHADLHVIKTHSPGQTCVEIKAIHHWFTSKRFNSHGSHLRFEVRGGNRVQLFHPKMVRAMSKELPGIGWERAAQVELLMGSMEGAVEAGVDRWAMIDGITHKRARRIWWLLRGFDPDNKVTGEG